MTSSHIEPSELEFLKNERARLDKRIYILQTENQTLKEEIYNLIDKNEKREIAMKVQRNSWLEESHNKKINLNYKQYIPIPKGGHIWNHLPKEIYKMLLTKFGQKGNFDENTTINELKEEYFRRYSGRFKYLRYVNLSKLLLGIININ